MAEEQRYQEGHLLCANNCCFFGSPATMNLCSKCYRDHRLKEVQANSAKLASKNSSFSSAPTEEAPPGQPQAVRCTTCRKRVGLLGFRCRCGITFCGIHRLPEKHGCSIDYKAVGHEAIARSNPVVKASKINHIRALKRDFTIACHPMASDGLKVSLKPSLLRLAIDG